MPTASSKKPPPIIANAVGRDARLAMPAPIMAAPNDTAPIAAAKAATARQNSPPKIPSSAPKIAATNEKPIPRITPAAGIPNRISRITNKMPRLLFLRTAVVCAVFSLSFPLRAARPLTSSQAFSACAPHSPVFASFQACFARFPKPSCFASSQVWRACRPKDSNRSRLQGLPFSFSVSSSAPCSLEVFSEPCADSFFISTV